MNKTIKVGSRTYEGRNTKAATQAAIDHLAALFPESEAGEWLPVIVRAPDGDTGKENVAVVFKDPSGQWSYRVSWAGGHDGGTTTGPSYAPEKDAKRLTLYACRRHLAQQAYTGHLAQHASCGESGDSLAVIHPDDAEGAADHKRWIRFQDDYARLRAAGLSANDAHKQACGY